ncbi:MAG: GNAT family N-acetyltransferase [bacterium]|nr:GNAT family N-acetyltransferase [bacterium]MDZ4247891.1 GNAT family N-acetyltransferase [Patescibacteria group bacterium]
MPEDEPNQAAATESEKPAERPRLKYPESPLTDGVVNLRPRKTSDIPRIVEACSDPDTAHYTTVPSPYTEADAQEWLDCQAERMAKGESLEFAIAEPESGLLVGSVGFVKFHWPDRRGEVGYWQHPDSRGKGYTTRALALLCRHGFETLGLERCEGLAEKGNIGSQKVLEKVGFQREGLLRSYVEIKGVRMDMVMFALLKGELRNDSVDM